MFFKINPYLTHPFMQFRIELYDLKTPLFFLSPLLYSKLFFYRHCCIVTCLDFIGLINIFYSWKLNNFVICATGTFMWYFTASYKKLKEKISQNKRFIIQCINWHIYLYTLITIGWKSDNLNHERLVNIEEETK